MHQEELYNVIISYFDSGKYWEKAIELLEQLRQEYQYVTFEYSLLADLLVLFPLSPVSSPCPCLTFFVPIYSKKRPCSTKISSAWNAFLLNISTLDTLAWAFLKILEYASISIPLLLYISLKQKQKIIDILARDEVDPLLSLHLLHSVAVAFTMSQNKQFIHRGVEFERLDTFASGIVKRWPESVLLKTTEPPGPDIRNSPGQCTLALSCCSSDIRCLLAL